jgi:hypothetical protein
MNVRDIARSEPPLLLLGANYVGARIEGSFQVSPAHELKSIYTLTD